MDNKELMVFASERDRWEAKAVLLAFQQSLNSGTLVLLFLSHFLLLLLPLLFTTALVYMHGCAID